MALALHEAAPQPELLKGIRRDCVEIEEQVADILLASKLDTVAPSLREIVDMGALLAEECARLGLPFVVEPVEVTGDTRLLRRLVRNLLENAVRHGGHEVSAQVARVADTCVLRVSDRGPGIDAAERDRIFEPFYRPAKAAETGSGWGLGLALVRQIATLHHGTIRCLERAQGGCTFELSLPATTDAITRRA
jgi:signal transduction histidine kinase